jgi:hypothetical protein
MPEARQLTNQEVAAIKRLFKVAEKWPRTIGLFANAGSLQIVDLRTGQVFEYVLGIPCDGGDPGTAEDENGVDWLGY